MTMNAPRPIRETDLGGQPGDPVDLHCFSPLETAKRILGGELTQALVEQVEVGAEFLPRARRGEHKCIQCARAFVGTPALVAWLQTPAGGKRAVFGVCAPCADDPNFKQRIFDRLHATETTIH